MQAFNLDLCELPPAATALREEVRAFLGDTLSDYPPADRARSWVGFDGGFSRKLGARGWLAPLDSPELGGAGLSPDENVVLLEELNKRGVLLFLEDAALALRTALLDWGSEAQRDRLVRPLAEGLLAVWKQRSVGGHPLGVTALPDADGYILIGQAAFSGSGPSPSWLWTLALVESDSPGQPVAAFQSE